MNDRNGMVAMLGEDFPVVSLYIKMIKELRSLDKNAKGMLTGPQLIQTWQYRQQQAGEGALTEGWNISVCGFKHPTTSAAYFTIESLSGSVSEQGSLLLADTKGNVFFVVSLGHIPGQFRCEYYNALKEKQFAEAVCAIVKVAAARELSLMEVFTHQHFNIPNLKKVLRPYDLKLIITGAVAEC
ncbi:hypothetical protein MKQ70_32270 [Chitinophaga sedimenti]|uniref:hypothetical protein n=1 Tax=Chitinophaga sedimenti TaxID=2033606 RepID=UPI0020047331|nr:hypothetical protein [Chitinophaga sedimenti]MCK7559394.1 hypothetical protein [Chitinophaga sedimenti]